MMKEDDILKICNKNFFLISGPCVIETYDRTYRIASFLNDVTKEMSIPFIFKASYDKANRTSIDSFRGPGIKEGLKILKSISDELKLPIMTDIHRISEVDIVAETADILQIPAFLCRQTDLLLEAGKTGKTINIKKGQFMSPWDVNNIIKKVLSVKNSKILLTERGVVFGYNNLVVDFRSIEVMKSMGFPVIFDATHSVQLPGGLGDSSGGQREFVSVLSKAAVSVGVNGIFLEVHENPDNAFCDGPNSIRLNSVPNLLMKLKEINKVVCK